MASSFGSGATKGYVAGVRSTDRVGDGRGRAGQGAVVDFQRLGANSARIYSTASHSDAPSLFNMQRNALRLYKFK